VNDVIELLGLRHACFATWRALRLSCRGRPGDRLHVSFLCAIAKRYEPLVTGRSVVVRHVKDVVVGTTEARGISGGQVRRALVSARRLGMRGTGGG
jgi:hypothetical protein